MPQPPRHLPHHHHARAASHQDGQRMFWQFLSVHAQSRSISLARMKNFKKQSLPCTSAKSASKTATHTDEPFSNSSSSTLLLHTPHTILGTTFDSNAWLTKSPTGLAWAFYSRYWKSDKQRVACTQVPRIWRLPVLYTSGPWLKLTRCIFASASKLDGLSRCPPPTLGHELGRHHRRNVTLLLHLIQEDTK
jgi:hypothetical protein